MRRLKQAAAVFVAALTGSALGLVYSAVAHTGSTCTASGSSPQVWQGHEHADTCYAGNGYDSMYGYGDNDTLGGELERDDLRGATGDDTLTDGKGNYDTDSVCDGDGSDYINVADGDYRDWLWTSDGFFSMAIDGPAEGSTAVASCPF